MKGLQKIIIPLIVVIVIFSAGCRKENPENIDTTKYASCCGTEPKIIPLYNNSVYVPNVFTPNFDGINDRFYPIAQDTSISNIAIQDLSLYTMGDTLFFFTQFLYYETLENGAWDGDIPYNLRWDENVARYPAGPFKYKFTILSKNASGEFDWTDVEGTACLIRCDEDAHVFADKMGCQFPVQNNNGVYSPSLPNRESDCFK